MPSMFAISAALILLTLAASPASALELENAQSPATSGTSGGGSQGRLSGANMSTGGGGPESENRMPPDEPEILGLSHGGVQAGGNDVTKELYEH